VDEDLVDEVEGGLLEGREAVAERARLGVRAALVRVIVVGRPARRREGLPEWERGDAGPVRLRRRPAQVEDERELLDLGVPGQRRLPVEELRQNAPDGPDVDRDAVPVLRSVAPRRSSGGRYQSVMTRFV